LTLQLIYSFSTGPIPDAIGLLTNLDELFVFRAGVDSTLPFDISNCPLRLLLLEETEMTQIPPELPTSLTELHLKKNNQVSDSF
jgi:hypothetical protein